MLHLHFDLTVQNFKIKINFLNSLNPFVDEEWSEDSYYY